MNNTRYSSLILGAWQSLPIFFLGIIDATVFGFLARRASLSFSESVLMSGFVASGTAQFLALNAWVKPLPIAILLTGTLLVNLRYLVLGATLRPLFAGMPKRLSLPALFFFYDENWALTSREMRKGTGSAAFFFGSGAAIYLSWVAGTAAGYILGDQFRWIGNWGLDFAFVVIFAAILADHWNGRQSVEPWAVAAIVACAFRHWITGEWYVLAGALAGSITAIRGAFKQK